MEDSPIIGGPANRTSIGNLGAMELRELKNYYSTNLLRARALVGETCRLRQIRPSSIFYGAYDYSGITRLREIDYIILTALRPRAIELRRFVSGICILTASFSARYLDYVVSFVRII